ncbi:MAG: DMT family transporter [Alphaproteobacteria bacterium]
MPHSALGRVNAPARAIALMLVGSAFLAWNDAVTKWLARDFPAGQVLCLRSAFILIPLLLFVWRSGGLDTLRVVNWRHHALNSAVFAATTFGAVLSVWLLPLSVFVSFIFASPILVAALSVPLLGERIGWRRWAAILVGFAGILIIVRPSSDSLTWGVLAALVTVTLMALRDLYTRHISRTEHSNAILFYAAIAATAAGAATWFAGPAGVPGMEWRPVGLGALAIFAVAGLLNGSAHFLMIESLRFGEAALVVPFRYTMMIWAILADTLVWGTLPDWPVYPGSALVVASGLYIIRRERLKRLAAAARQEGRDAA